MPSVSWGPCMNIILKLVVNMKCWFIWPQYILWSEESHYYQWHMTKMKNVGSNLIFVCNMVESWLLLFNFMFWILVMGKINDFYYLIKAKNMALRLDHNIPIKKGLFHLHAIVRIKPCIRGVVHVMNLLSPDLGGQYDLLA